MNRFQKSITGAWFSKIRNKDIWFYQVPVAKSLHEIVSFNFYRQEGNYDVQEKKAEYAVYRAVGVKQGNEHIPDTQVAPVVNQGIIEIWMHEQPILDRTYTITLWYV